MSQFANLQEIVKNIVLDLKKYKNRYMRNIIIYFLLGIHISCTTTYKFARVKTPHIKEVPQIHPENINLLAEHFQDKLTLTLNEKLSAKKIALTFDDGPTDKTRDFLQVLKKHNAKATFCVLGEQIEKFPDVMYEIVNDGHEVCNHSYSHSYNYTLTLDEFIRDTEKTNQLIEKFTLKKVKYYRPPYGIISTYQIAKTHQNILFWSVDTRDWLHQERRNKGEITDILKTHVSENDIILFHDGGGQNKDITLLELDTFLEDYKNKGFDFSAIQ